MPDLYNYLVAIVWMVTFLLAVVVSERRRPYFAVLALILSGIILFTFSASSFPVFAPRELVQAVLILAAIIAVVHVLLPGDEKVVRGFWLIWAAIAFIVVVLSGVV